VEAGVCVEGPLLADSEAILRGYLEQAKGGVYATEVLPPEWETSVLFPSASILAKLAAAGTGIVQTGDLEPLYLRDVYITRPQKA
jgi:hypothetical protein